MSDSMSRVRSVTVRQLIPEGLAQMAPGPELGVLLGGLNISALTGTDLVEVLRARARQLSHEQAQLLAAMVEVGLCDPHARPNEVARLAQAARCPAHYRRARGADQEAGDGAGPRMGRPPVCQRGAGPGRDRVPG